MTAKLEGAVILACSSLTEYVEEAQRLAGTDLPVIYLNRLYHRGPKEMQQHILQALAERLPDGTETVLVAMGFCGGVWHQTSFDRTVVIPRVDDCISLLLHTDDAFHPNLKDMIVQDGEENIHIIVRIVLDKVIACL